MAFSLMQGGGLWIGPPFPTPNSSGNYQAGTALQLAGATIKIATVFIAPKDGTLHSFELRQGTVGNTPDNGMRFSFQNLDAAGDPDGTQDQYRDVTSGFTSNTWLAPPGPLTNDGTDTGTKRTVTAGDKIAAVVEFVTFVAGDSIDFSTLGQDTSVFMHPANSACYPTRFGGATWTRTHSPLLFVLRYDDGYEWLPATWPVVTFNQETFAQDNATADERGLRYKIPFDFELAGVLLRLAVSNTNAAFDIVSYSSTDSVLDTISVTGTQVRTTANAGQIYIPMSRFSPMTANHVHRLVVKPTTNTGTGTVQIQNFDVNSNSILDACWGGAEWYHTMRVDGGSWTDTTTRRPWIGLQLSRIDAVIGGGRQGTFGWIG